ncbi:unnamed protein product [Tuber aestivum]|uniref:Uncharacterized protein n=1 Tax=Tuber aestivum TaxID=59557 RepID=A0A292PWZ2_9PEZI|nr:unnamed protein product [Tuber aestivum]
MLILYAWWMKLRGISELGSILTKDEGAAVGSLCRVQDLVGHYRSPEKGLGGTNHPSGILIFTTPISTPIASRTPIISTNRVRKSSKDG